MNIKPNDKAKINSIQDATCMLIGSKGYEKTTIQDIANEVGVNTELVYKYFPDGKFDILKRISHRLTNEMLMLKQPENIDFNDFPGYMRTIIKNLQQFYKDNNLMVKAMLLDALSDGEIVAETKKMDLKNYKDYKDTANFFVRFSDVKIGSKDPLELLMYWGIMVKGIIFLTIIYPMPVMNEEVLTDLMVDLSLTIWGYQKTL